MHQSRSPSSITIAVQLLTGKIPWVVAVEVDQVDELDVEALALYAPAEVEVDELLLCRVEPEARHHHVVRWLPVVAAAGTARHVVVVVISPHARRP